MQQLSQVCHYLVAQTRMEEAPDNKRVTEEVAKLKQLILKLVNLSKGTLTTPTET